MLGARPVAEVVDHAGAFVDALTGVTGTVVDLGSGGGVPGLVIALARPDLHVELVDRRSARTDHLHRLVRRLGLEGRVAVRTVDAERLAIDPVDAVVARGFGPPMRTLRTATRLARSGGLVIISEPPVETPGRWPSLPSGVQQLRSVDARIAVFEVSRGTSMATSRDVPRGTDGA